MAMLMACFGRFCKSPNSCVSCENGLARYHAPSSCSVYDGGITRIGAFSKIAVNANKNVMET